MSGGLSRLQIKAAAFLIGTFLAGLLIRYWQLHQPLPQVDLRIAKRFQEISDSLNALTKIGGQGTGQKTFKRTDKYEVTRPINVNIATMEELQKLPGIGAVLATRIIAYREKYGPFRQKEQLLKVKGIGKKTLKKFSGMIIF